MKEITQLEHKYLVARSADLKYLNNAETIMLIKLLRKISDGRKAEDKPINKYVVMNLSDKLDIQKLIVDLEAIDAKNTFPGFVDVDDVAVTFINAILSAQSTFKPEQQ